MRRIAATLTGRALAPQLKHHMQLAARYSGSDFMSPGELSLAAKLAGMDHVLTEEKLDLFFNPRESPRGAVKDGAANWRHINKV